MWACRRLLVTLAMSPFLSLACQEGPRLEPLASASRVDSRGGGSRMFRISSTLLGEPRSISVLLPASHGRTADARHYPVIVILDGESQLAPAASVVDELSRHGMMPEAIVVAIDNTNRLRDLTPPGMSVSGSDRSQGGDRFLDFVERELLPAVDRQFRGGEPRVLVGHSSGGILATYAAATRTTFRGVVAIDVPVHLDGRWLSRRLLSAASGAKAPLRFAAYSANFPWPESEWTSLKAAAPAQWQVHYEALPLEGHETVPMLAMYLGLRQLFADYSRIAVRGMPPTDTGLHYQRVGTLLGADLAPPERVLEDMVSSLLSAGQGAEARAAYARLSANYGSPGDSARTLARIAAAASAPPPSETVAGLLATPFPSVEEARPYLGDWRGDIWFKSNQPRPGNTTLRIRVDSGKVIGEVLNPGAPPQFRVRRVDYLRVTPTGLTFGFMNGMEPRGVMLHEGVLQGNTLAGNSRFGGVVVEYPPDDTPDPGFRFVRVTG